jgi:hypothetical protein
MSILGVAIVPPHPTQLSLRMAVALYVTGISTPEVHPEFPPLLGTLTVRAGAIIRHIRNEIRRGTLIPPLRPLRPSPEAPRRKSK